MTGVSTFRSAAGERRYLELYDRAMRECPPPDAVHDVETRHGTTRVHRFGDPAAPPLVLLPGLMAASPALAPLIPALAAHRALHTVDMLGEAGRSVHRRPFADLADRARGLDEVLGALGLDRVHVAGASSGGWHAFQLAVHAPDRLTAVTLLDPTTLTAGYARAVLWRGAVAGLLGTERAWRWFVRWSAGTDLTDRPEVALLLAGVRHYRPRVPFQRPPADEEISSVTVPVTALFGGRSVVHDSALAAHRLRTLLPHSDVEVLPDAGHDVHLRPADRDVVVDRLLRR
jgi:pimeloyl-ACP methyl ester carboxylesterase